MGGGVIVQPKPHGNTGNKNGQKYKKAARVNLRCEESDKQKWEAQAKKNGQSLAEFISQCCNRGLG